MSLTDYVAAFKDGDGGFVNKGGKGIKIGDVSSMSESGSVAMACHVATFLWLYRAKHAGEFPGLDFLDYNAPQTFINQLLKLGHPSRVTSSTRPNAGDVLVFANADGSTIGQHSCVVLGNGKIAGYNQVDWLAGGIANTYTEHDSDDINWVPRGCLFTPRRADVGGQERYVWAVREATALGAMT